MFLSFAVPARMSRTLAGFLLVALVVLTAATSWSGPSDRPRVLRVGFSVTATSLETWDPHLRTGAGIALYENVMEPLVAFASEKGDLRPMLAESWNSSPDGTVWTFRLRRNVKFHDGSIFKSDAVKYALDRIHDFKQSPVFPLLNDKIKSYTIVDDYSVRFTVNQVGPPLTQLLTMMLIVSPTAGKKNDKGDNAQAYFRDNPVGTGPYRLHKWDKGSIVSLIKNPDYWGGWDRPHYTGVIYQEIPEAGTQQLMLERGDLDIALTLPVESLATLKRNPDVVVQEEPGLRTWLLRMNMLAGPTRDVRVRKALAYAFDYDGLLRAEPGITSAATGPVPGSFMGGWVPDNLPKQDLNRARALLVDAGVPPGTTFTMLISRGTFVQPLAAEILQANLKKIGYDAKIDLVPFSAWSQQVVNWIERENLDPARKPSDIFGLLVPPRLPDPWAFLWFNYHSEAGRGSGRNWYQYRNPAVDDLIDKGSSERDRGKRLEMFKQAARRIVDDQPDIFISNDARVYVRRKSVKSIAPHPSWAEGIRFYLTQPSD